MSEKLTLYHGSNYRNIRPVVVFDQDLFGKRYPDQPKFSGTLTTNHQAAELAALAASDLYGANKEFPVILVFEIPRNELINEGPLGNNQSIEALSTNHQVPVETLPDDYLKSLGITRDEAMKKVNQGELTFFKVSSEYLKDIEFVPPLLSE